MTRDPQPGLRKKEHSTATPHRPTDLPVAGYPLVPRIKAPLPVLPNCGRAVIIRISLTWYTLSSTGAQLIDGSSLIPDADEMGCATYRHLHHNKALRKIKLMPPLGGLFVEERQCAQSAGRISWAISSTQVVTCRKVDRASVVEDYAQKSRTPQIRSWQPDWFRRPSGDF